MLKLGGFAGSNYYNKVKLVLLEKEIPFEEELQKADRSPELYAKSPLGKIPYLMTEQGLLVESEVLVEYLEDAYPQKPLMPADPYQRAKVREMVTFIELHLELVARELYMEAFFGKPIHEEIKRRTEKLLKRNAAAFKSMVKFSPYIMGEQFTAADCAAVMHLPLVGMASKIVFGEDVLADLPIREYTKKLGERATVAKVSADRKAYQEAQKR
jgi:glutathione S-transferase